MKKLTIIGLGLMGASIAWNAKKARVAETIVGFDQRRSACNIAMDRHFVDATSTSLKKVINFSITYNLDFSLQILYTHLY